MQKPARFGSYEALEILGEGGMGTVYKGRDPRFDRYVAVKVLHDQFRRDAAVLERFRSEAIVQAKLSHPNIVTVYDFIADDHCLGMVLEFIDGLTLDQLIEGNGGPLTVQRSVHLMSQILSAMAYAHQLGLVHRDIKPSNIMIVTRAGEEIAKVMDFGIAKILGAEKLRTATSAKMGTLAYMSPEQVRNPRNVDQRSDIYSLGATLFEMLTGRIAFDGDSEYELMQKILEEPVPRMVAGSGIPSMLEAIVARAMEKDPAMRFQSCEEFRQALLRVGSAAAGRPNAGERPIYVPVTGSVEATPPRYAPVVNPAPVLQEQPAAPPRVLQPATAPGVTAAAQVQTHVTAEVRAAEAIVSASEKKSVVPIVAIAAAAILLVAAVAGFFVYRSKFSFTARLDSALAENRLFSPPGNCVADIYAAEKAKGGSSPEMGEAVRKITAKLQPMADESFRKWYADSEGVDWNVTEKVTAFLSDLNPSDAVAVARHEYALGTLALQSQQHSEALRRFETALRSDPSMVLAANGVAKIYVQDSSPLKNESLAVQYYERAASMDPNFTCAPKNLGEFYMRREEWTVAEYHMQRALRTSPDRPSILRALARIYYNQGRFAEALDYNQRFLRVATDPVEIQKANQAIDAIHQKGY